MRRQDSRRLGSGGLGFSGDRACVASSATPKTEGWLLNLAELGLRLHSFDLDDRDLLLCDLDDGLPVESVEHDRDETGVAVRRALDDAPGDPLDPRLASWREVIVPRLRRRESTELLDDRRTPARSPSGIPRDARLELPAPVPAVFLRLHPVRIGTRIRSPQRATG